MCISRDIHGLQLVDHYFVCLLAAVLRQFVAVVVIALRSIYFHDYFDILKYMYQIIPFTFSEHVVPSFLFYILGVDYYY